VHAPALLFANNARGLQRQRSSSSSSSSSSARRGLLRHWRRCRCRTSSWRHWQRHATAASAAAATLLLVPVPLAGGGRGGGSPRGRGACSASRLSGCSAARRPGHCSRLPWLLRGWDNRPSPCSTRCCHAGRLCCSSGSAGSGPAIGGAGAGRNAGAGSCCCCRRCCCCRCCCCCRRCCHCWQYYCRRRGPCSRGRQGQALPTATAAILILLIQHAGRAKKGRCSRHLRCTAGPAAR
jgi:hypothetical protein